MIKIVDNTRYNVTEQIYKNIKFRELVPIREGKDLHEISENITIQCLNFLKKYKLI